MNLQWNEENEVKPPTNVEVLVCGLDLRHVNGKQTINYFYTMGKWDGKDWEVEKSVRSVFTNRRFLLWSELPKLPFMEQNNGR